MSTPLKILLTGATGYIGGSVLSRLLQHPNFASFIITALVRSPEKGIKLKALGINTVVGALSDISLLESLAENADVVFPMADNVNYPATQAILKGLKKRNASIGTVSTLIHTSGTGILADHAAGDEISEIIYDDMHPEQIETLPDTQIHQDVDLAIVRADAEGYVRTYNVLPPTIFGAATGVLVDQGIQNQRSQQIPALVRASLARGQAGMVGEGKNIWPNANIDDVADFYIMLFDAIQKRSSVGHGREGYYFLETAEHTMYELGQAIGEAMVALGKSDSPVPTTFTKQELLKFFGGSTYLGTNCRCRGSRSRTIGWKPVKSKKDFLASVKPEVEALAKLPNSEHEEYFNIITEMIAQAGLNQKD